MSTESVKSPSSAVLLLDSEMKSSFIFAGMSFPAVLQHFQIQKEHIDLFVPEVKAVQEAYRRGEISFPYWSKVWASAIALSEFLLLFPHYVQNKKVVELGAGLGLPSLVAARYASNVLCTDYAPEAVHFAAQTALHHRCTNLQFAVLDWNSLPQGLEADVVLLSDINYEPVAFKALMKMVSYFLEKQTTLLLATPQRLMAKEFIFPLLSSCRHQEVITVTQEGTSVLITVLVLQEH